MWELQTPFLELGTVSVIKKEDVDRNNIPH